MGKFSDRYNASLASLPLHGSFRSLGKTHSSMHYGFSLPTIVRPHYHHKTKINTRFKQQGCIEFLISLKVEESELLWPGSFRKALEDNGGEENFILTKVNPCVDTNSYTIFDVETLKPNAAVAKDGPNDVYKGYTC